MKRVKSAKPVKPEQPAAVHSLVDMIRAKAELAVLSEWNENQAAKSSRAKALHLYGMVTSRFLELDGHFGVRITGAKPRLEDRDAMEDPDTVEDYFTGFRLAVHAVDRTPSVCADLRFYAHVNKPSGARRSADDYVCAFGFTASGHEAITIEMPMAVLNSGRGYEDYVERLVTQVVGYLGAAVAANFEMNSDGTAVVEKKAP